MTETDKENREEITKSCCKCFRKLPLGDFSKGGTRNGKIRFRPYCRSCDAVKTKSYRARNAEKSRARSTNWRKNNLSKKAAEARVREALKAGKIQKLPCLICGEIKVEGHHPDYNEPLKIQWLCKRHHMAWHRVFKSTEKVNEMS